MGSVCDGIRTRDYVYQRGKCKHFPVDKNLGCETEKKEERKEWRKEIRKETKNNERYSV